MLLLVCAVAGANEGPGEDRPEAKRLALLPLRWLLALGFVLMIVNPLAMLVTPFMSKYLIDDVVLNLLVHILLPIILIVLAATPVQRFTLFSPTLLLLNFA